MFKRLIFAVLLLLATYCAYAGMGMGLDMGMSTGGGAGGSFPSAPANALKGYDGNYIMGQDSDYIGVYTP